MVVINEKSIYWCDCCQIPIIKQEEKLFYKCPVCNNWTRYLSKDIRPVFPEERLLIELITGKPPHYYMKDSVWCNGSTYYINGTKYKLGSDIWKNINIDLIKKELEVNSENNKYEYFDYYIEKFVNVNKTYLYNIEYNAVDYIRKINEKYPQYPKYVSFSGGKDSTVVSDLVIRALGNPSVLHVFCDTTLEYPYTLEYIEKYKKSNPKILLKTIKNKEHSFYSVCDDIGVPSVKKRWCCTIFKTGITSKFFNDYYKGQRVLTFSGLRNSESTARRNYRKFEDKSEKRKIQNQIIVSPVLHWNDADVWLYLLSKNVYFNKAYRLGFHRVGCWCCPNTSLRGDQLAKIYMPEPANKWYEYLTNYARKIGKENPKHYVDSGNWKLMMGGQGLKSSDDVKIIQRTCTIEENARVYTLNKEITDEFYNLFVPFGKVSKELGRKILNEVLVLRNTVPIISIQKETDYDVKIKTLNVSDHKKLQRKISYQILKYNACRRCFKCEGICKNGAITISNGNYHINSSKCNHCLNCVNPKYIEGGCTMKNFLKTKGDNYGRK